MLRGEEAYRRETETERYTQKTGNNVSFIASSKAAEGLRRLRESPESKLLPRQM